MFRGRWAGVALFCAALTVGAGSLAAQESNGFKLRLVQGEVGGSFDASWTLQELAADQRARRWREWVQLALGGSAVHPKVLGYRILIRPSFAQGLFLPQVDSLPTSGAGDAFTGSARLDLFPGAAFSGAVTVHRDQHFRRTRFGGWHESAEEGWQVEVRDNNPLLPAKLTVGVENRDRGWLTGLGGRRFAFENRIGTIRYAAQNRKTHVLLERIAFDQRGSPSLERRSALFRHTLRWGSGSSLRSGLQYLDRVDGFAFRSFSWSETATLRQAENVTTELRSSVNRSSSPSGRAGQVEAGFNTRYQPFSGSSVAFDGLARRWSSDSFDRVFARAGPLANVTFSLPAGARLATSLEASYEHHGQGGDGLAFVDALQELHIAGSTGFFRLNQAFVDRTSIVVSSSDGSEVYQEGFDYRIVESGPFIEIHVLPGSRIEADEQLAIDYRYELSPEVTAGAITLGYDVRLRVGRLTLRAQRRKQDDLDEVPTTVLPILRNHDRSSVSLVWDLPTSFGSVSLFGEQRRDRTDRYAFESSQLASTVTVRLNRGSFTTLSGRVQELMGGARPYSTRSLEQSLVSQLSRNLRLRTALSHWYWRDNGEHQTFWGFGAGLDWTRRFQTVSLSYDWVSWVNGSERSEHRVFLSVKRRF